MKNVNEQIAESYLNRINPDDEMVSPIDLTAGSLDFGTPAGRQDFCQT